MNHIVVIGFMGSGKTRVGKRLSSDLGLTFVDVDKVIVKKMNMSVKEILQKFGEPYYLLMPSEKRILRMATDLAGKIHTVRQKRAACRAWVHPMRRRCSNCKHELTQYKFCAACVHEGWPVYWEPRKEGES